jgi:gas vesicle protein
MADQINIEDHEKIATVLADTIRETAKLAGDDALAFVNIAERTGDALVAKAEETAKQLREVVDRFKGRMKDEMSQLAEEMEHRSNELADEAASYIRHCAESRTLILDHHRRLNGKTPEVVTTANVEREMAELVAASTEKKPS